MNRRQFLKYGGLVGAAGLVGSYPVVAESHVIRTNHYRIPVPHLPEVFTGFRIVHLTDLHHGIPVSLAVIRHVIDRVNRLDRDLIVCTGDYVHEKGTTTELDAVWPLLADLNAPFGVHAVLGNHDHWADTNRSDQWLRESGQDLRHKVRVIEQRGGRIWIAGAGDLWEDHRSLDAVLRDIPDADCRLVLAHNPDTADSAFTRRVDLVIAGHTHGGQVTVPFVGPPILPVRNRNYSSGFKTSPRGTGVFISKGIGWSFLPVRFNCPPEIAVLELVPGTATHPDRDHPPS